MKHEHPFVLSSTLNSCTEKAAEWLKPTTCESVRIVSSYQLWRLCRSRLRDCAAELRVLLQEEKLAGASLLVLANKQDLPGALPLDDIERVS